MGATPTTQPGAASMSEKTWERNTAGIAAHAQKRKEQKRQGIEEAIAALLREQKPVNFHTVAKRAAVSKAYLYSQQDLRERIDALRLQEMEQRVRGRVGQPAGKNDASRELVMHAQESRITALEAENQ